MITMTISTSTTLVDFINTTLNNSQTTTITSTMPIWIQTLTLTSMILIDISAFLGNLLVICAFFRTRRLQTVTNYFIASLAFADALVAIFVLPLSIYYYQRGRSWKLGLILCDLWVSSDVLLCTSSILNLTCISVDRYMAITRPLTYTAYRSKFLARVMILLVWIFSVVITCPPIFGWRDSNRRYTVEQEHICDLNTARGYVVYSALGSFYIPAVVMIFVYIRIFMVVYSRENLINKFHDNNNNNNNNVSPVQIPIKKTENDLINTKNLSDGLNDNNINLINKTKKSFCCYSCFRKKSQQNNSNINYQKSIQISSNPERKQNGYLIYRFTNNNNNNTNSAPNTPPSLTKSKTFCRPCTISTKKIMNLSDEIYNYRRNYLSRIGAEYQFRTGDSPCYELKTFQNSLPPLIKCRSHSLEQAPTNQRHDFNPNQQLNTSIKFIDKQRNEIDDILLSDKKDNKSPIENLNKITRSLNELSNDITQLSINKQTKISEINYPNDLSKHPRTISPQSSSSPEPNLTNSSTFSNIPDQKFFPEQTRINRRAKPLHLAKTTPSTILIDNIKQQHKISQNNNSSLRSNISLSSIRRNNENNRKKSKYSCCCYCCLTPLNNWYENKTKQTNNFTPNQSLTNDNDDDDDEKISLNDTNNRTLIITTSNTNLRAIEHTNQNISLTSHHQSPTGGITTNPSNDVNRRERIRFMKEQKTAKILAVVVGGFILFWLPFFIMYIIPPETFSFNAQTVTLITWLGYFNSVINPFIYAYCSKQFRMAFWNITFGICIKKSNVLLPTSIKNRQLYRHPINP